MENDERKGEDGTKPECESLRLPPLLDTVWNRVLAAFQFLTILPVPSPRGEPNLGRASPFFPVVGLFVGVMAAAVMSVTRLLLPRPVPELFAVLCLWAITGGLHLDGLADTMDAALSSRTREQKLQIMKDPTTGAMGVAALWFALSIKAAALCLLAGLQDHWWALLSAGVWSRWSLVISARLFRPGRPEGGLGRGFIAEVANAHCIVATVIALALAAALCLAGVEAKYWWTLMAAPISLLVSFMFSRVVGGHTGDTLGATSEVTEIACLLLWAALSWPTIGPPGLF